jgi:hypothetical protein
VTEMTRSEKSTKQLVRAAVLAAALVALTLAHAAPVTIDAGNAGAPRATTAASSQGTLQHVLLVLPYNGSVAIPSAASPYLIP